jgi:oxygen-independent coproporphyrinogen III oxidase
MTTSAHKVVPSEDAAWRKSPTSLYIHIPFCASRCFYCDFTTYVAPESAMEAYVDALITELEWLGREKSEPLQTVFFGGGTPTLLSASQLTRIFDALRCHFQFADGYEMTIEANPGTVDQKKFRALVDGGVNRISFGAQTLNPTLLMAIGRSHDKDAILESIAGAKDAGIQRINVDLMFGLPEQSLRDVEQSIEELVSLDVEHISAYWLKVEPGTPFAKWQAQGLLPLPGEDEEADMYDLVRDRLQQLGYVHYEVSNFARPFGEARHNLVYWRNEPYLAAGVAAHGLVNGERYENVKSLKEYTSLIRRGERPIAERHTVSRYEACEDTMMLGLRLCEGVSNARFSERHGVSIESIFGTQIQRLMQNGLLEWHGQYLRLTDAAWPVANLVFEQFVGIEP